MTDMQQAIKIALNSVKELLAPGNDSVRLEEIEFDLKGKAWNVTVSYIDPAGDPLTFALRKPRLYKVVRVNFRSGTLESIKMLVLP